MFHLAPTIGMKRVTLWPIHSSVKYTPATKPPAPKVASVGNLRAQCQPLRNGGQNACAIASPLPHQFLANEAPKPAMLKAALGTVEPKRKMNTRDQHGEGSGGGGAVTEGKP